MPRREFPGVLKAGLRGSGGKGGGGEGRVAQEAPDSLQSKQVARVLDLLCEGEIKGIVGGPKGVYLSGTPIQNADDTYNFTGVTYAFRPGTQAQEYIPGFETQEQEVAVTVRIKHADPVTRQINNLDATDVRITLSVPTISQQNKTNGDLNGSEVEFAVEVQPFAGSWATIDLGDRKVIRGKQRSKYQRSLRIPLTGSGPWNIRVTRQTDDSVDSATSNDLFWDSLTEIVNVRMTYPNMAVVGLHIDSAQFTTIPQRAYLTDLLIVRVPVNYDPATRVYTGVWDGTFKLAWTDNPAWCFYDLVTNKRYGLGENIPEELTDKWALYEIGKYCDQLVPDGKGLGGMEPRYALNVFFQTREEAFKVVNDLASMFRGMLYWAAGALFAVQDAPTDPVAIFNSSNIIDGLVQREGAGRKARHTVAVVTWNNPDDFYRAVPEFIQDDDAIARFGYRESRVVAIGCTSQGQAHRAGAAILYTEKYESQVLSWRAGMDAAFARPGQVVMLVDANRQVSRLAGRVNAATTTTLTVDAPVVLQAGRTYQLSVMMPDGVTIVYRPITNAAGTTSVLTFTEALPSTDIVQAAWVLIPDNVESELVRVLAISEESPAIYRVTGMQYYPGKYAAIEEGFVLQPPETSTLLAAANNISPPTDLVVNEVYVVDPTGSRRHADISWTPPVEQKFLSRYLFEYKITNGNWIGQEVLTPQVRVMDIGPYEYAWRVRSISVSGKRSTGVLEGSYTVDHEVPSPLGRVTGLELLGQGNDTIYTGRDPKFTWRANSPSGSQQLGSEAAGGNSGFMDPIFKDYEVSIYKPDGTLVAPPDHVLDNRYTYTSERNLEDGTGRNFILGVRQRDRFNRMSPETRIAVSNPNCAVPPMLNIGAPFKTILLEVARPVETDWEELHAYIGTTSGFTPDESNRAYRGRSTIMGLEADLAGTTYWVKYAASDSYGLDNMVFSQAIQVTTGSIEAVDLALQSVSESHLFATLGARIALIDAPGTGLVTQVNTLQSTTAANSAAISVAQTVEAGLLAQYTVKVDVNGYVAGYGLASTLVNGVPFSEFLVRADRFSIGASGSSTVVPFTVVGGVVYMASAMIKDASIAAAKIISLNANQVSASSLAAITATLGSVTAGNFTLDTTGYIAAGATGYGVGTGIWMGYSGGAYKFFVGNATRYIAWDGTNFTVAGDIIATGNIQAASITTDRLVGNAVTASAAAGSGTASTISAGTIDAISVAFTTAGGPLLITAMVAYTGNAVGSSVAANYTAQVYAGATHLAEVDNWAYGTGNAEAGTTVHVGSEIVVLTRQRLTAGTYTFYLKLVAPLGGKILQRTISVLELKR